MLEQYPPHTPPPTSQLWVPNKQDASRPTYVPADSPVTYYARMPASLFPQPFSLEEARRIWADALLNGSLLSLEGRLKQLEMKPGAKLVGGALEVVQPPSSTSQLTTRWAIPEGSIRFFETIARYGEGRHEMPVERDGDDVLVGFSSAHNYAVLDGDNKVLPRWAEWAHRMYARFILDDGVRELQKRASLKEHVDTGKEH
ncbi:uncharacterized protein EV420DRAFT_1618921 [Desarmillaria tabescens]|uniref:Uncharacterized protein n=1 Tax=Armillaria tabescens TaxID=1929756 RepID=A0AA39TQM3_ARMTA|nr:uncharacterized protein EV420DRAFT_1618921 [Desarmillaria tabescens]KAK0463108.1 hypothetical protein EV420DRAFT_1618921 [Desarmillaria tabescens]